MKDLTRFLAALFAAITLSVLLANLFQLPVKLSFTKDNYLIAQQLSSDLLWLSIFEAAAFLLTLRLVIIEKKKKRTRKSMVISMICFIASMLLFFIFILPIDINTVNWTVMPDDWDSLRSQWEYTNAGRTLLDLTGFIFIIVALLKNRNYYKVYT